MKRFRIFILALCLISALAACHSSADEGNATITLAAAASLEQVLEDEIIPLFESLHEGITVSGVYGGSFHLQTQIEQGLPADLFFPADETPMLVLLEQGLIQDDTMVPLLTNRLALITHQDSMTTVTGFADILYAETIAIGDPQHVPAGRYAREVFESLGLWDSLYARASLGMSVSAVLSWVASLSAEVGIVYQTDALQTDQVWILALYEGALPIVYPAAVLSGAGNEEAAHLFLAFLQSTEVREIFAAHGFGLYSCVNL